MKKSVNLATFLRASPGIVSRCEINNVIGCRSNTLVLPFILSSDTELINFRSSPQVWGGWLNFKFSKMVGKPRGVGGGGL